MNRLPVAVILFCLFTLNAGCAGRRAFEAGEDLVRQGRHDAAVTWYAEAVAQNPDSQEYRMKLIAARSRAALEHLKTGRRLFRQEDFQAAAVALRQATALDPSLEEAGLELRQVEERLRAQQLVADAEQFYKARKFPQAKNALQEALQLSPGLRPAEELMEKVKADRRTVMLDGFELDVASDQPITLKFRDADVREVFNILSKLSGINFIFDDDIRQQKVSVLLEKATFGQAMELLLKMNNLGRRVLNPKTIIIYPKNKEKEKQYEDQIIQTFYLSNIDAKKAVNMLRTMLQLRKIYVHEELNALVIRDNPEVIKLAQQVIEAADRADSEVVFDLELVEVTHSNNLDLGPRLDTYSVGLGMAKNGKVVASGLQSGVDTANLVTGLGNLRTVYTLPSATFDFAKTLADSEILANPKIRVKNREKSSVHVGEREPVITVTTTNETVTDNIQYVDVGVKLKVEPVIQLDDTVVTKLDLEVSSVTERTTTTSGSVALRISTTNTQTSLTLRDGERTIIGGLIRDDNSNTRISIPLIGDIPVIGPLLTNYQKRDRKRELLLSITPHIVKSIDLPRSDVGSIWSGGEEDLKAGPNFGSFLLEPVLEQAPTPAAPGVSPSAAVQGTESGAPVPEEIEPGTAEENAAEGAETPSGEMRAPPVPEEPGLEPSPQSDDSQFFPVAPAPAAAPPGETPPAPASELPQLEESPPAGEPTVSFLAPKNARPGQEFAVEVTVDGMRNLYSAPLFVNFNPTSLEFVRAEEGSFLKAAGQTTVFSTSVDSQAGRLIIGYKQGVGGKGASGSGTLFRLHFRGKAPGSAEIGLDRLNFRDPSGNRLPVPRADATIEVR